MLSLLIMGCSLLGYSLWICRYWAKEFSIAWIFSIASVILLLYIGAFLDVLPATALILFGGGAFSFLLAIFFRVKWSYQALFLLGFVLIVAYYSQYQFVHHNDSLVFWGAVSKTLFLEKQLPGIISPVWPQFNTYPLGVALFHYYFLQWQSNYTLLFVFVAQNILWFSPLLLFCYGVNWREGLLRLIWALAIIYCVHSGFLGDLSVDLVISTWAFAAIVIIFIEKTERRLWLSAPILLLLPLIKEIGGLFSLISLSIMLLQSVRERNREQSVNVGILFLFVLGLIIAWHSYCHFTGRYGLISSINNASILHAMNPFVSRDDWFLRWIFLKSLWFPLIVMGLLSAWTWKISKDYRPLFFILISGFLLYLLALYFLETIQFEDQLLFGWVPGVNRYLWIYFLPMVLVNIFLSVQKKMLVSIRAVYWSSMCVSVLMLGILVITRPLALDARAVWALHTADKIKLDFKGDKTLLACLITAPKGPSFNYSMALVYELIPYRTHLVYDMGDKKDVARQIRHCNIVYNVCSLMVMSE